MYIYQHYTFGEIIDLDDASGRWTPIEEDDNNFPGVMSMAQRSTDNIRGSYTIENGKRYAFYWSAESRLVLRTPDDVRYELFERAASGAFINLMAGIKVELGAATFADGHANTGHSEFRLVAADGTVLVSVTYNSRKYMDLYLQDFTYAPDRDLSDWDFFVSVKREIEAMTELAGPAPVSVPKAATLTDASVTAQTGELCPKSGDWVVSDRLHARVQASAGERMPPLGELDVTWVWVG